MTNLTAKMTMVAALGVGMMTMAYAENEGSTNQGSTLDKVGQVATQAVQKVEELGQQAKDQAVKIAGDVAQATDAMTKQAEAKMQETAEAIEKSEQAQKITAGILGGIYALAELLAFAAFYWVAFALMVAGVVSWTGQVVIAKLVVAASSSTFNMKETISDIFVLVISLFGLVLTTQAATENSTFTQSAVAVLSSTAVGVVIGLVLYFWGQSLEMAASNTKASGSYKK